MKSPFNELCKKHKPNTELAEILNSLKSYVDHVVNKVLDFNDTSELGRKEFLNSIALVPRTIEVPDFESVSVKVLVNSEILGRLEKLASDPRMVNDALNLVEEAGGKASIFDEYMATRIPKLLKFASSPEHVLTDRGIQNVIKSSFPVYGDGECYKVQAMYRSERRSKTLYMAAISNEANTSDVRFTITAKPKNEANRYAVYEDMVAYFIAKAQSESYKVLEQFEF